MKTPKWFLRNLASLGAMILFTFLPLARAGNDFWSGGGGLGFFWQVPANWQANTNPAPGDQLYFTGNLNLKNNNNFPAATSFAGINFQNPAGPFVLSGNSVTLGNNITNGQTVTPETISLPLIVNGNVIVDVTTGGVLNLNGRISGTGSLTLADAGTVNFNTNNSYSGPLTVNAGTAVIVQETNLPAPSGTPTAGNIILNNGILFVMTNLTINTNRGITLGSPSASGVSGSIGVNLGSTVFNGAVMANNTGGASGFTKKGPGTLTLYGANTFTGATSNRVGTLNLDFSIPGAPANNIISSSSPFNIGGETFSIGQVNTIQLNVTNQPGAANSQTFNGTFFDLGGSVVQVSGASSGAANLSLGALNHTHGGVVTFATNGMAAAINTASANLNGILGGWATTATNGTPIVNGITTPNDWASADVNGNIVPFNNFYVAQTGVNLAGTVIGTTNVVLDDNSTGDIRVDADNANSTTDINSFLWTRSTTFASSFTIGTNNTLRLGQFGGIMLALPNAVSVSEEFGSGAAGAAGIQDSGTLTAGGAPNTPGEIVFTTDSASQTGGNSLLCEVKITDNGSGAVSVVKTGPGPMKLRGHNTFSGGMYILQGRIQMAGSELAQGEFGAGAANTANPDGFGSGPIYVLPGAEAFPSGSGGNTNAGLTAITNNWFLAGNGISDGVGAIRLTGVYSNGVMMLIGETEFGGGGPGANPITGAPVRIYDQITGSFGLDIGATGNASGTAPYNNGCILLNPNNNWTGNTTLFGRAGATGGTCVKNGANDVIPNGFGKGNVQFGNVGNTSSLMMWDLNGCNETINGLVSVPGVDPSLSVVTNTVAATNSILTLGDNDASATFNSHISGNISLQKIGAGIQVLGTNNTYTGGTTVSNGTLQLAASGSIPNTAKIIVNGGTMDVSLVGSFTISMPVNVTNGTFITAVASSGSQTVNFNNSILLPTVLSAAANLTAPTVNLTGPTNLIQVVNVPREAFYPQTFPIIKYTTALNGFSTLGFTLPSTNYSGYLSNDAASTTVYIVVTNGIITPSIFWTGLNGVALDGNWNTTDNNFAVSNLVNGIPTGGTTPTNYVDNGNDIVNFNDLGGTNKVNITGTFNPANIIVNNTTNSGGVAAYTFYGSGVITGTNSLQKQGSGTLILANTPVGGDTYSGGAIISGGTVQVGDGTNANAGSLGSPSGFVVNNGSLVFKRPDSVVVGGSISGSGPISNLLSGTLALGGANSFSGPVVMLAGVLQAGNNLALGATNGATTINPGAALDVNGFNLGQEPIFVSGIGTTNVDGTTNGAIYSSAAAAAFPAVQRVTLLGDTVLGAPESSPAVVSNGWSIQSPVSGNPTGASLSTGGNAYNLTKVGLNKVGIVDVTVDPTLANIDVQGGVLDIEGNTTGLGNPASTLTVENDATLSLANATNQFNKNIVLNGNGLGVNSLGTLENAGGNNTIVGAVTLNGNVELTFRSLTGAGVGGSLTLHNSMTGSGSLTKEDTNTLFLTSVADGHNGGTTINDGTFILNGMSTDTGNALTINTHTLGVPTTLGGNGTNAGPVVVNDTFWPGVGGNASTFGSGNISLSVATAIFSLGTTTTAGGGVNDLLNVNGSFDGGGSFVKINPVGALSTSGTYTLVNFTGSRNGNFNGGVNVIPALQPSRYQFSLDQTTANKVNLTVTHGVGTMEWNNAANNATWDVAVSQNWTNLATASPVAPGDYEFEQFDSVLLDDSIITAAHPNTTVKLNSQVYPSSITVNSTTNYTITGGGSINGTVNLLKTNSSKLQISTANNFSGTVTISGGTLLVDNSHDGPSLTSALGLVSTTVIVTNGGTLDVGGPSLGSNRDPLMWTTPIFVAGSGVNGKGALVNNLGGASQNRAFENLTLTADTTFGGALTWGIQNSANANETTAGINAVLSTGGHAYNLTKNGTNIVILANVTVDPALANVEVVGVPGFPVNVGSTLSLQGNNTGFGNPASNLTVDNGAILQFVNMTNQLNKVVVLRGGSQVNNNNGANVIIGPVTLNDAGTNCYFNLTGGTSLAISNVISGPGNLVQGGGGSHPLILGGTNTYTGSTIVSNATLSLVRNGSIGNSTNLILYTGTTLDASARVDATLTLNAGSSQLLVVNGTGAGASSGGTINGSLTNTAGTTVTLAPGVTNMVSLTVNNKATLNGTVALKLNAASLTNDVVLVTGNLVYGGTLNVTNLAGALAAGNTFKLFNAASYNGSFGTLNLPPLGPGLAWTNGLAVNGSIGIVSSGAPPFTHTPGALIISLNGVNIVVTGTNGDAGSVYYLLSTTNVADLKSLWKTVATNVVGSVSGPTNGFTFIGTNVVVPGDEQQFYLLSNTNAVH